MELKKQYSKMGLQDIQIKLWQLFISVAFLMVTLVGGWISINLQIKELQVNQNNHLKKIELNTRKFDIMQEQQTKNQMELMEQIYEIKIILKDKEDRE